jgi:tight adherence protein B
MTPVLFALLAGIGTYFIFVALQKDRSTAVTKTVSIATFIDERMLRAGIKANERRGVVSLVAMFAIAGAFLGCMIFAGAAAALVVGVFTATFPVAAVKQHHTKRKAEAAEAWPRLIEEIRLTCSSLGRPIPQALIEVGKRGPQKMRPAFVEAEREWLMTTDFNRTVTVLRSALADPTADTVCETLVVAYSVGGTELDRRLAALVHDRQVDLDGRKDARAKQSGVRFARRFVLAVPLGMALVGTSIGNGRAAYGTPEGQAAVVAALLSLIGCWWWSGRLIRLPEPVRVFRG